MMKMIFGTQNDTAGLLMRLTLGCVMLPHGLQKVFGMFGGAGLQATMNVFTTKMGLPAPVAVLVILAESAGALGLIFGFFTRLCALGIAMVMGGAIFFVHAQHGFFMNWSGRQSGEGFEYHLLAIGLALALIIHGAGKWSLDQRIAR
ncbi:MAG: DoxX family protein [Desulfuromonas sp.]|nr:DoxX family protein [Desulfuromonas sp.]